MTTPRILAFAGSNRSASVNRRLLLAAVPFLRQAGADVTVADLREFPMPIFDGDLEASSGLPESAVRMKALMREHHGFLIASPEFNSSITPLLKNVIDWCSRPSPGECYAGKVAALISASPGALGGLRGLVTVRSILSNIGVLVTPQQLALSKAMDAFDESGALKDEAHVKQLQGVAGALVRVAGQVNA